MTWPRAWPGRAALAEEADDRRQQGPRYPLLEAGRGQQPGIGAVAHVPALDEHLGNSGEVQSGEVVTQDHAVVPVIVAGRHRGVRQESRADVPAEPRRW